MKHICAAPSDMLQTCAGFTCLSFLQYRMSSCQWTSGFPKVVCWPSWHHSHCMSSAIRLERQESLNTSDLFSPFQFTLCSQMCTVTYFLFSKSSFFFFAFLWSQVYLVKLICLSSACSLEFHAYSTLIPILFSTVHHISKVKHAHVKSHFQRWI